MELSDEERARRSALAKQLHAAGRFGGKQPGSGRPRNQRASEIVAEKIRANADKVWAGIDAALDPKQPASVRLAAAEKALKIENAEAELQLKEEAALKEMSTEQLIQDIVSRIGRVSAVGGLPDAFRNVIDLPSEEVS